MKIAYRTNIVYNKIKSLKKIGVIVMDKKVILITGGASGIGYGILKYLLDSNKY